MKKFAAVVLALWLMLVCNAALADGDARVENFESNVLVLPNGSLEIEETITYRVTDSINGFTRDIDLSFGTGCEDFTAAYVLEDGERALDYDPLALKGDTGVYYAEALDNGLDRYYMFMPCRDGDVVTMVYRYTLTGVCERYPDVGVLDFPLLGDAWEMDIENYSARISFEHAVGDDIDVRVHSAGMNMTRQTARDGVVEFAGTDAGDGGVFRVRLMFPSEALDGMELDGQSAMKQEILAREAEFDALRASNARLGYELLGAMVILAALLIAAACMRWGRDPRVEAREYAPGGALPIEPGVAPAEISVALVRANPAANALAATLLDLARRGYIAIEGDSEQNMAYVRTALPSSGCAPHEQYALEWILNIGDGTRVQLADIKRYSKRNSYESEFNKWSAMVKESAEKRGWFAPRVAAQKVAGASALTAFAAALIFGIVCLTKGPAYETLGFTLLGGALALFMGGMIALLVSHRTPEGARVAADWNAVRKWMKGGWSVFDLPADTALWEQLMVYALILGTDDALAKRMDEMDPSYADAMCNSRDAVLLRDGDFGTVGMVIYGYYCHSTAESMSVHTSSSSGGGSGAGGGGGGGTF